MTYMNVTQCILYVHMADEGPLAPFNDDMLSSGGTLLGRFSKMKRAILEALVRAEVLERHKNVDDGDDQENPNAPPRVPEMDVVLMGHGFNALKKGELKFTFGTSD
jgi:hypothetical protein